MADRLKGKTAVIFGAGSSGPGWGNGKAAAVAFAREGARVVCIDLVESVAAETAEIIAKEGATVEAIAADVTQLKSVEAAIARSIARFEQADILHNNVGVTHLGDPVEPAAQQFQAALDLNTGSVYRTAKAVLPYMIKRHRGAINNISSLAAIRWTGYPDFAY